MITCFGVYRLPAGRTLLAVYAYGNYERDDFYEAVLAFLRLHNFKVQDYPDDETIYVERWKGVPRRSGYDRIVRCADDDPDGKVVTAIDLKKWSRGRKPKDTRKRW